MNKDIMYTLNINYKNIDNIANIEKQIKDSFEVKFLGYDQYELKVSFVKELSDKEEKLLFNILEKY